MTIYPAIDLCEGKAVRLTKGDFTQKTVYSDFPEQIAEAFEEAGASWIHIVDLEGAKTGVFKNLKSVEAIHKKVKCKIQFGGGVRSLEAIEAALASGASRVVLGTKALDGDFFKKALKKHGPQIAVGIDVRDNKVQTQGWLQGSDVALEDAVKMFNESSVETLIYTDIQRDGMLNGPNFERLRDLLGMSRSRIILSGGIGEISDIRQTGEIRASNFEGVIVGKAIYEKKFTLQDALKAVAAQ